MCIVYVPCVLVCTFTQEEARIRRKGNEQRETPIELPGRAYRVIALTRQKHALTEN